MDKVVVAMSGGVDSSVAALMLHEKGFSCIGISMQVWDYRNNGGNCTRATCCAPDDFTDARKVAAKIGIPYYVFDFEKTFRKEVIDKFVSTYEQGETPNPCVDCNNKVKFRELRERALKLGFDKVATGHYAQVEKRGEIYHLLRGADPDKDQSYFLYGLQYEELSKTHFPVGHLTKDKVREFAKDAGLGTASKAESQDICFVAGTVKDFLINIGRKPATGLIVHKNGTVIGNHDGISHFTVGQRKGLKVGGHHDPLYVIEIDPVANRVIVGEKSDLEREKFLVKELSFIQPQKERFKAVAQLRHRHKGVEVEVELKQDVAEVKFLCEWATASPGQACVFYDKANREVIGGGRIK